jgi:phage terminase small subunit
VPQGDKDMLQLLQDIALGRTDATPLQVRAAVAAVQYTHTKKGDGGKKDEQAAKAKGAGAGKFGSAPPPLKVVGR